MFKNELSSKDFMYDEVKYIKDGHGEEGEEIALNNLKENTLLELINIYDKSDEPIERDVAKLLILRKLQLVDHGRFQYALDEIIGELNTTKKGHNELEKIFKSHRHNMDKNYSEKPAW